MNQRGQTSYTGYIYTIDRWKIYNTTLVVGDGYVNSPEFFQYLDIPQDKVYTFAACAQDGTVAVVSGVPSEKRSVTVNEVSVVLTVGEELTEVVIRTAKNVLWAALYEGSYTAETLPPYIPKGYGVELMEC